MRSVLIAVLIALGSGLFVALGPLADAWRLQVHAPLATFLGGFASLIPGSAFGWGSAAVLLLGLREVHPGRGGRLQRLGRVGLLALVVLSTGIVGFGTLHGAVTHSERLHLAGRAPRTDGEGGSLEDLEQELRLAVEGLLREGVHQEPIVDRELAGLLSEAFDHLLLEAPWLAGPETPPVRSLPRGLLAGLGLSGFYSPWTGEPHVEAGLPRVSVLAVAAHEWAHMRGEAREDEASFVGWQALAGAPDPRARLSGHFALLRQVWRELGRVSPGGLEAALGAASRELLSLEAEVAAWWREARTPAAGLARASNDLYLRAAGDARGVESYAGAVGLVLRDDWPRRIRREPLSSPR